MPVERTSKVLEGYIAQALELHAAGEEVRWDMSLTLAPTPDGGMTPAYLVVISIPGALIGQRQSGGMTINADGPFTAEGTGEAIGKFLEQMRAERSREFASVGNGSPT